MNRSLKLSMLLALGLASSQAAAIELGQIQVRSVLGQPLVADIPLTPNSPADLQNLNARLASSDEFARANISGPSVLLQFSITGSGDHRWIRITSSAPINDPYLDLLIEVSNASGSSTHEYAVLLDPPGGQVRTPAVATPSSAATGRATRSQPGETAQSSTHKPARHAEAGSPPIEKSSSDKYGPVERGQTLSTIARATATPGVNVNQMMLALKQANPDAFYRDNINALKTGAILRVPSHEDAQAMAIAAAAAEVLHQNDDWRNHATRTPTAVADAATRTGSTSSPTATGPAGDRLSLVPAQQGGQHAGGKGGDEKAAKQESQRNQESLTALQQQDAELQSRVKDLESINGKNERLLALKDNEIAELQRKLADARKGAPPSAAVDTHAPTTAPVAAATVTKPVVAPVAAAPASVPVPVPSHAATTAPVASTPITPAKPATVAPVAAVPPVAAKPAAAKPAVVTPAAKPAPVIADETPWYMQPWAWLAGLVVIILLLLLGLRGRRRAPKAPATPAPSLADRFGAMPPIGSADPDQDELLDHLAEHPDDVGLHLELVSLYYSRRDVEHFEAAAEAMHAHITDPDQAEWQDVLHMGRDLVPGHPLFATESTTPPAPLDAHEERAALHPFDLDHYATAPEGHEEPPPPPLPPSGYNYSFDRAQFRVPPTTQYIQSEPTVSVEPPKAEPASRWHFDEPTEDHHEDPIHAETVHADTGHADRFHADESATDNFSDDPSDTKLDLARAYLDMGDPDGARAMLEEVLKEGSQMQRDVAKRLLDGLH